MRRCMLRIAVCLLVASVVSSCGKTDSPSESDTATSGPIDGDWRIDGKTCNGADVNISAAGATTFSISNTTGRFFNQYSDIPVTLSYPGNSVVKWVIGENSSGGVGDQHTATYSVQNNTLTLVEEMTPASEYGCSSGYQVSTLTKQ